MNPQQAVVRSVHRAVSFLEFVFRIQEEVEIYVQMIALLTRSLLCCFVEVRSARVSE